MQWDERTVRILDPRTGQLLREHLRQQRGLHRIKDEDKPAQMLPSTTRLLARCEAAGPHIGALCQRMYRDDGVVAIRRIQGILSLARKHGAVLADDGLRRRPGERHPANLPLPPALAGTPAAAARSARSIPIIRQLTLYRDLIADKTQENPS